MKGRGTMRKVSPGKHTTVAQGSTFSDAFVPGWDCKPGQEQHRERVTKREAMGQKMTPLGPSRAK